MSLLFRDVRKFLARSLILVMLLALVQPAAGQSESVKRLGQARGFFALPVELDLDSGAANDDANILRIMPLYTFPVFDNWKLVNLTILTMADAPGGTPAFPGDGSAGQKAGLSDLLHASFATPTRTGNFVWGAGIALAIPTATDDALGNGKWAAGPAFRVTYRTGPWNLGLVATQRWSFRGSSNRADVNQLLMRGFVRRQLSEDWYFVYSPLITANWDSSGDKWLVPVGGGIGRTFTVKGDPWAWSVQGYYNVIKPDPAPDWVARFAIVAAIPFGED
jgi:hypothetical protein